MVVITDPAPGLACTTKLVRRDVFRQITSEKMRQTYLGRVVPLLQEVDIEVPVQWNEQEKRWVYGELPWNEWNQLQRRLERPAKKNSA